MDAAGVFVILLHETLYRGDALSVTDPELRRDIVSLDFVKNLVIDDSRVSFTIELEDLKLSGDEETFTIAVQYDTEEMFGKLAASRKIVIER